MKKNNSINIALIGQGFMGKAHSNAWGQVRRFFNPDLFPVLHTNCGEPGRNVADFARHWGWENASDNWKETCRLAEIGLVDVVTPNFLHGEVVMAALEAGKHVCCEKPLARDFEETKKIVVVSRKASGKSFVWFNYRRCPAVALAYKLVKQGRIGDIRHVRAQYLQQWADESVPLTWRFDKNLAGSGAHGDLNAHIVDLVRFVTGQEISEVCGAISKTFVKRRKELNKGSSGRTAAGKKNNVTVDDTLLFLANLSGGGVASFEAARQATGNFNRNCFEINGTNGSLRFDFERMNELQFFDATLDPAVQGWTTILCTRAGHHPYVDAWWPDGHIIGYEHTFVNMASDVLRVLAGLDPIVPLPDFEDAFKVAQVLEAAMISANQQKWVRLTDVK